MQVIDLIDVHLRFVTFCTHVDDPNEDRERIAEIRKSWLRDAMTEGLKVKVAIDEGKPVGFAHYLPIELGAWGMSGKDMMTIPCLTLNYDRVYKEEKGSGYGRALVEAVEEEAKKTKKGVAVLVYDNDFWFMPFSFFQKLGYKEVDRQGDAVLMLKAFEPVEPPVMHKLDYEPSLFPGKVVIDAFWNPICLTSILEIHNVRNVCAEYGDRVILNDFNCGEKGTLEKYQTSRALFINGKHFGWGYAAPKDELKKIIEGAMEKEN